jgi:hypothetical protein
MSIPLDRLYHYIDNIAKEVRDNVIIYRFWPHGSKNIEDLTLLNPPTSYINILISPEIICHDQEPLDYDLYSNLHNTIIDSVQIKKLRPVACEYYQAGLKNAFITPDRNLRYWIQNIYDKAILLHSEQRSQNLEKYRDSEFIPVYYWSHAVIALDWFRYAFHIDINKKVGNKTFLIYNRAWSGTREYRLKFLDLLISNNLLDSCHTSFSPVDNNTHYTQHKFKNTVWKPNNFLENVLPPNTASGNDSADFVIEDYQNTVIEVVLETLFDDNRWHLTEKSLRPIACGQPFILCAPAGSLKYLQSYGFKTFSTVWDESYDEIIDPLERLKKIVELMSEINQWDTDTQLTKLKQANQISQYNRAYFFSKEFFNLIVNELKNNLTCALTELENTNTGQTFLTIRKKYSQIDKLTSGEEQNYKLPSQNQIDLAVKKADLEAKLAAEQYYIQYLNKQTK